MIDWLISRDALAVSVVLRLRLMVSGWGLRKRRSVPPYGPLRLGKGFYFTTTWSKSY